MILYFENSYNLNNIWCFCLLFLIWDCEFVYDLSVYNGCLGGNICFVVWDFFNCYNVCG